MRRYLLINFLLDRGNDFYRGRKLHAKVFDKSGVLITQFRESCHCSKGARAPVPPVCSRMSRSPSPWLACTKGRRDFDNPTGLCIVISLQLQQQLPLFHLAFPHNIPSSLWVIVTCTPPNSAQQAFFLSQRHVRNEGRHIHRCHHTKGRNGDDEQPPLYLPQSHA